MLSYLALAAAGAVAGPGAQPPPMTGPTPQAAVAASSAAKADHTARAPVMQMSTRDIMMPQPGPAKSAQPAAKPASAKPGPHQ